MIKEQQIAGLVNGHLEGTEFFLVEVSVKSGNRITVFLDGDHRVSIETCREVSRFIESQLDREAEDFDLTVSSAGADRPLKLPRQYRKNTGSELEIITIDGAKFTGKLLAVGDQGIEIEKQPERKQGKKQEISVLTLSFDQIKTAKEVISFKK